VGFVFGMWLDGFGVLLFCAKLLGCCAYCELHLGHGQSQFSVLPEGFVSQAIWATVLWISTRTLNKSW
jgi:hypothetical protein